MKTQLSLTALTVLMGLGSASCFAEAAVATDKQKCYVKVGMENGKPQRATVSCYDSFGQLVSQSSMQLAALDKNDEKAKLVFAQYDECDPNYNPNCADDYDNDDDLYVGGDYGYRGGDRGGDFHGGERGGMQGPGGGHGGGGGHH